MQWQKTKVRLQEELQLAEQTEANNIKGRAESLQASGDLDGLVHLREELHNFGERAESPDLVQWAKVNFGSWLVGIEKKLREKQGDKASFDGAVSDFNSTKEKGDLNRMSHEVLQKFQKLANGSGATIAMRSSPLCFFSNLASTACTRSCAAESVSPCGGQTVSGCSCHCR